MSKAKCKSWLAKAKEVRGFVPFLFVISSNLSLLRPWKVLMMPTLVMKMQ